MCWCGHHYKLFIDPLSCFLVPQVMLNLWIFGLLVAYLRNFYSRNHYFLADPRCDAYTSLLCALAPGAIFPIISELLFTWNLVLWTLNMMSFCVVNEEYHVGLDWLIAKYRIHVYQPQGVPELEAAVTLGAWALGQPWHKPNQPTNSLSNRHDAQIQQFVRIYLFYYCYMIPVFPTLFYYAFSVTLIFC